jgi:hypothetical protein
MLAIIALALASFTLTVVCALWIWEIGWEQARLHDQLADDLASDRGKTQAASLGENAAAPLTLELDRPSARFSP